MEVVDTYGTPCRRRTYMDIYDYLLISPSRHSICNSLFLRCVACMHVHFANLYVIFPIFTAWTQSLSYVYLISMRSGLCECCLLTIFQPAFRKLIRGSALLMDLMVGGTTPLVTLQQPKALTSSQVSGFSWALNVELSYYYTKQP